MAFLVGGLAGYGMGGLQNVVSGKPSFVQQDGALGNCISDCVRAGASNEQCIELCKNPATSQGFVDNFLCAFWDTWYCFSKPCDDSAACKECEKAEGEGNCRKCGYGYSAACSKSGAMYRVE